MKSDYLNSINFQDSILRNSAFLIDRLNEYIFDLNEAIAKRNNTSLDVTMIDSALNRITASKFKDEVIYSLTSSAFDPYSAKYDHLLDYLNKNYYSRLAVEMKNKKLTEMVVAKLNAIIGKKAANISLGTSDLYSISADSTLVIFWSTTCSHCMIEIPKIYKKLSENDNIKVVLVGLEDEYSDWETQTEKFPNWINKRANGKWTNEYALSYFVKGTPAYFLLDKNKTIIAKPEKLKHLEKVLKRKID